MAGRRLLARSVFTAMSKPPTGALTATRRLHATVNHLNPATSVSSISYPISHEKILSPTNTKHFIDNQFVESQAKVWIDLHDPATNNLVTRVPQSTDAELKAAVDSAAKAFPKWKATSLLTRQQVMFKLVALIRQNWDRLAASITLEQGKTLVDARGDVLRGLQVAEVRSRFKSSIQWQRLIVAIFEDCLWYHNTINWRNLGSKQRYGD